LGETGQKGEVVKASEKSFSHAHEKLRILGRLEDEGGQAQRIVYKEEKAGITEKSLRSRATPDGD